MDPSKQSRKYNVTTKVCAVCLKSFESKSTSHIFCSKVCNRSIYIVNKSTKQCIICKKDFIPNGNYQKYCSKDCFLVARSEFRYFGDVKKLYNLDKDSYNTLLKEQDNRCGICGKHQKELSTKLCVDHDHNTGSVRKLLCSLCNKGLGAFLDNPDLLLKAASYLHNHKKVEV